MGPGGPRIRPREDDGIDYAPEVDPYEEMDVEGLLNLEDYVPPQGEKQIAPKPPKYQKYEMDPSYWQIDPGMPPTESPPAYDDLSIAEDNEPLSIEAPPDEGEEDIVEANKILDHLELPNYDDVQKRLDEPEMTAAKQRNYLEKVVKDADRRRRQVIAMKSAATKKFNKGEINAAERDRIHGNSDKFRLELNDYIKEYRFKSKSIKGYGTSVTSVTKRQLGRGVYFYDDAEELRYWKN